MVDTKVDLRIPEPRAAARRNRDPGAEKPGGAGALRGRLEINHRDDTFTARVFLKNTTETDVTFTVSNHGVPKAIVPTFTCERVEEGNSPWPQAVCYRYFDGRQWRRRGGNESGYIFKVQPDGYLDSICLALDEHDRPHLAWGDAKDRLHIYYRFWDGSRWAERDGSAAHRPDAWYTQGWSGEGRNPRYTDIGKDDEHGRPAAITDNLKRRASVNLLLSRNPRT